MKKEEITWYIAEIRKGCSDKRRKPLLRIMYEWLDYYLKCGEIPKYYFRNMVHRRGVDNCLDYYLGNREFRRIRKSTGDPELGAFLENKILFHEHFKESSLRLPSCLGYTLGKTFFCPEGRRSIQNADAFYGLIEDLTARSKGRSIFAKPISGIGGRNCFKINAELADPEYLAEMHDKVCSSGYLFQETIIQHPVIDAIYPFSVNTLRIHTCIRKNFDINVVSVFMRFGSKGSFVEGGGLGTIYIDVDMKSGKLGRYARKNFEYGGEVYTQHPDTGHLFEGVRVPDISAALETARSAAALLPYRLVGWDVAISEEGPVLIEGNDNFGFWAAQIADGGYKKNMTFQSFYEELMGESK